MKMIETKLKVSWLQLPSSLTSFTQFAWYWGGGCVCTNERAHIHLTRVVLSLLLGHWQPGRTLLSPLPCLKGPCQPLPRILCLLLSLFLLRETYFIEAGPLHNTKNHREVGPLKAHTSSYPRIGSFLPPEIGMW